MVLVVQHIKTEWTKEARGGKNAVLRNAIPEVEKLPLVAVDPDRTQFLFHCPHNRPLEQKTVSTEPFEFPLVVGAVTINQMPDVVLAKFRYTRSCGAPNRDWMHKTLRIASNEWGQIIYNGRFSSSYDGDWWYEKHVVNVGWFDHLTPSVFTREAPTYRFNASALLF